MTNTGGEVLPKCRQMQYGPSRSQVLSMEDIFTIVIVLRPANSCNALKRKQQQQHKKKHPKPVKL